MDLSALMIDSASLNFSDAAETITVADSGQAQTTQVSTSVLGGATLLVSNPATVFATTAGNGATDVIEVKGFGSNFAAAVNLFATGAADEVRWRASDTDLAGISVTAGAILLDTAAISTANELRLAGPVGLAQNVSLSANDVIFEDGIANSSSQALTIISTHIELHGAATLGSLRAQTPASVAEDDVLMFILESDLTATGLVDIQLPLIISGDVTVTGSLLSLMQSMQQMTSPRVQQLD